MSRRKVDMTAAYNRESFHVITPGGKINGKGYSAGVLALIAAQVRLEKGIGDEVQRISTGVRSPERSGNRSGSIQELHQELPEHSGQQREDVGGVHLLGRLRDGRDAGSEVGQHTQ